MPSIMNRIAKESFFGGRSSPAGSQSRKGRNKASVAPAEVEADENLDLFSKNRLSLSLSSSDQSVAASVPLMRLSFGSGKVLKTGLDDLISSAEREKHDYDWLLTPPGTPLDPSSDGHESQATPAPSKKSALIRSQSVSTAKASSRLSVSRSESNPSSRLARSTSVTRSLSNASQFSTYSYSSMMSSSVLNTSSASVSSYIRPSSPSRQSFSTARPSTSSARPMASRSATPSRTSPAPGRASTDRARPSRNSVSSAPSPRIQMPASSHSSSSRSNSRASTPTRRLSMPPSLVSSGMSSVGRATPNGRITASGSCPSSPGPRVRSLPQMDLHLDFPNDIPPNLRISLPDRALSAGRTRPGMASVRANSDTVSSNNSRSKQSSPIARRGRPHLNEHVDHVPMPRKIPLAENTEFRRTVSRKSLDMSARQMDNKAGTGRVTPVSGGKLYPQSMRPAASKHQVPRTSTTSLGDNNTRTKLVGNNWANCDNGRHFSLLYKMTSDLQEPDIFESYRHDASLLEEDLKSTNWLCSFDDKSDYSGLMFDSGLDLLPEPFGPL
uniref:Uncharacterized protein n=1 Tax=Kalanchoe fedtschenkoi TaxID=63787 RepID=A0A7N0V9E6_KALFE